MLVNDIAVPEDIFFINIQVPHERPDKERAGLLRLFRKIPGRIFVVCLIAVTARAQLDPDRIVIARFRMELLITACRFLFCR